MARKKTLSGIFCPKCHHQSLYELAPKNGYLDRRRYECADCGCKTTRPHSTPILMRTSLPKKKRYIVTAAQNATPIHKGFWATLQRCAEFYDAELVVIPGRYKNPTSQWTQANVAHEYWAEEVQPHLVYGWIKLNSRLVLLGDVKIQWAARAPLAGLDALTKDKSGIVGHGSRAVRSIATPQHRHPKIMYTTGACTVRNYTDSKRGVIAKFNHCMGALIVEVDGDVFFVRQLNATKSGSFIDLDLEFTPDEVRPAARALSVSLGDAHHRFFDPGVKKATFTARDSLVKTCKPKHIVWHDVIDFHARNHHHTSDWITRYAIHREKIANVKREFDGALKFVSARTPPDTQSVIVSSNHDRAALRWLKEADFRDDPENADFYLDLTKMVLKTAKKYPGGITYDEPFILYGEQQGHSNIKFLRRGQSFVLGKVEYGFHGDVGPNGSRGSTQNLSKMGIKVTKGHNHTAEIIDGCYSAGKCTGVLEYEIGQPSSHTNSHVVQYANDKRVIVTVINGRYCLPRPKLPKPVTE